MSGTEEEVKEQSDEAALENTEKPMPSSQGEEETIKKRYGGIMPKKPPLISKDHERAYFDSADWALGKPTQQQTRYRKSPYAPAEGEDGSNAPPED
nr:ribosome biogenesis protein erb1-like [Ipomoea trifida]